MRGTTPVAWAPLVVDLARTIMVDDAENERREAEADPARGTTREGARPDTIGDGTQYIERARRRGGAARASRVQSAERTDVSSDNDTAKY